MKYSILYPYYKRPEHILRTLGSLTKLCPDRLDFEIIFIMDLKNNESDRTAFFDVLEQFWHKIRLKVVSNDIYSYSSVRPYNIGAEHAIGEFIILSNPECVHKTNILVGFDEEFEKDKEAYVVCACESVNNGGEFIQWYQHSVYLNRKLHFCSSMSKNNYLKLGGFDEDYVLGIAYEDNDWIERVEKNLKVIVRDDLIVSHFDHPRAYNREDLTNKNGNLLNKKRTLRK